MRGFGPMVAVALLGVLGACAGGTVDGSSRDTTPGSIPVSAPGPAASDGPSPPPTQGESDVRPLRSDLALVNTRPRDTPFDSLEPWIDGIGYVRAWGGSRAMVTFPTLDAVPQVLLDETGRNAFDVINEDQIDGLLALQQAHGTQLVYDVNVNDQLDSQTEFLTLLLERGVDIAMLEMGNELYLPKFAKGDTSAIGVTRAWTVDQYVDLLRDWGPRLRDVVPGVPLYGVGASHGSTDAAGDTTRRQWNESLFAAIKQRPGLIDGITFHHYAGGDASGASDEEVTVGDAEFAYLDTFGDLPVAITESGYRSATVTEATLNRAEAFWSALRARLKPGDVFGIHVMYNPSNQAGSRAMSLYDENGRTAVGDRVAQWLSRW